MKIQILNPTIGAIFVSLLLGLPAESHAADKLKLIDAISQAISSHPSIAAAHARQDGARSSVTAVTTLPPPMVGVGMMGESSPWSEKMENSYEISQEVPFPTKILSNRAAKSLEADSITWALEQQKRDVIKNVKKAFFMYAYAFTEVTISEERVGLLKKHLKTLSSKPVSSGMIQAHVATIDGETEKAEAELVIAKQDLSSSRVELNLAMGQTPESTLLPPDQPPISPQPTIAQKNISSSPRIQSLNSMKEALESERSMAYQGWIPDFSLKYRYNKRYDTIASNHEFMAGITLPFVPFWSTSARAHVASAKVIEAEAGLRQTTLETEGSIQNLLSRTKALREVHAILTGRVLPSAEKRLHLVHRISQTDMETLDEHRMAFENLSDIKMKIARTRMDYEVTIAELESLVGEEEGIKQ